MYTMSANCSFAGIPAAISKLTLRSGVRQIAPACTVSLPRRFYSSPSDRQMPPPPHNEEPYTLHGLQRSLFTRKVEAGLQFYPFKWNYRPKTLISLNSYMLEKKSGTKQVPVVTGDNGKLILKDSTQIYDHLDTVCDQRGMQNRRMFPHGLTGVYVHVIEEYFDEWFPRNQVHMRWHFPESARDATSHLAREMLPHFWEAPFRNKVADGLQKWGIRSCKAVGMYAPEQYVGAEKEMDRVWQALERQLDFTDFVLGDRPCAVDTVLLGVLRNLFLADPEPKKRMPGYENINRWASEDGKTPLPPSEKWGELAEFPEGTHFSRFVLKEMVEGPYREWVLANAQALKNNNKTFKMMVYGLETSFLTRPVVEESRQRVRNRVGSLRAWNPRDHIRAIDWLKDVGLHDVFAD
eukprot:comp14865_c0_seq1/m.11387 comp14865_c0_seq1/g.11387  ORF comp14865_c0_seq1/g.11387 comp14865_c0_seq1/m.11387 type:complete len:407 (-) comp14865_c0_seq1:16-1236(-)